MAMLFSDFLVFRFFLESILCIILLYFFIGFSSLLAEVGLFGELVLAELAADEQLGEGGQGARLRGRSG